MDLCKLKNGARRNTFVFYCKNYIKLFKINVLLIYCQFYGLKYNVKVLLKNRKITVIDLVFFPSILCYLYVSLFFVLFFACKQIGLVFFLSNFVGILREFFWSSQFRHPFFMWFTKRRAWIFSWFFYFFLNWLGNLIHDKSSP